MPSVSNTPVKLSPIAEQVAECYALVYPEAPGRSKALQWINRARKATTGESGFKSTQLNEAIEELVAAQVLLPSVEGVRGVAARGPLALLGNLTRFCVSAHERGTAKLILNELEQSSHGPGYGSHYSYRPNFNSFEHLEQQVRLALIGDTFERLANERLPAHIWIWLTEPRAKPYLERLPMEHRQVACTFGLSYLIHFLHPTQEFAKSCESVAPNERDRAFLARVYAFQGKFKKAITLIKSIELKSPQIKHVQMECQALRAMISTLKGDDQAALASIEATLEIERNGSRKRILYPDTLCFSIALFSLVRLDTTESRALLKSLIAARTKLKIESDMDLLLLAAENADKPVSHSGSFYVPGSPSIISALYAIASRWHSNYNYPESHTGIHYWLQMITRQASQSGYHWVVAELQTVLEASFTNSEQLEPDIRALFAEQSANARREAMGAQSLTHLVTPIEPWEYSLRELEQLALKSKRPETQKKKDTTAKARRLIWQLSDHHGSAVEVTPVEQTRGKNGEWSSGRRVALKRLLEQADTMEHLIDQDLKASRSIQKVASYGWGGATTYETTQRTTYQLVGHPGVYDPQGERVDVVERPPVLHLSEADGTIRLIVEPELKSGHYLSELDAGNRRLNVTHFTAAHRRIDEAIPAAGLRVPSNASDRLHSLLNSLAGDISVQGDTDVAEDSLVEGDSAPLLAIEPFGSSLRVRIRVEPLPASGTFFDAGTGGSVVYVQTATGSQSVQRDLDMENTHVQNMVMQSSVLASHYDGRPHMVLDETLDALELLEEAQEAGIRCLWPEELPFRIKARANVKQVNLSVKSGKDWFTASGSLALGDTGEDLTLERLLKLVTEQPGTRFIELGNGDFVSLSTTLKQQLDTLQAFSRPKRDDSSAPQIHPMALLALDPLIDNATIKADKTWKQLRQRISDALTQTPTVPAALQAELRTYQQEGFAWLAQLGQIGAGACLADDMGLGKTVQALAVLLSRAEGGPTLVVAPTSVVGNWLQEAQRFAPSLKMLVYADITQQRHAMLTDISAFDVVVISYGLLVNDIEYLEKVHWHSVVLDEAQSIKNAATRRAKCARQLHADFRIVTTGTPVQNNLMDLHSLFAFLNPQLLGSETAFRRRFALPITRDNDLHAREQLQMVVSPFLLRRHKRDVLKELPARTEITLDVKLSGEEALLYETIRQEALASLEQGSSESQDIGKQKFIILSYLTKLRRLCCNPSLVSPGWTGPTSKLDVFSDTLAELIASGHKALVFSQFVDHLKIIEQHLIAQSISYQYIDGSVPAKQRTSRVSAFQGGVGDVFLISLTAGGTGLNLTAADYVIHLDPWWNPAVEDQASDRAHRLGQQRPVTIVRMVTTGTIEEQIQVLHGSKRDLADSVLAGADSPAFDTDTMIRLLKGSAD
ncbi:DEAD/DEAH box helicase [Granulosicoccus antarcticus]|uniref:RNA polymerase-associated protein RapA n=1 Tax=Granulosicoccus antarcticus IMCC3135 TaxID=1192854 RepID=A0A2Z2NUK6_9GAMM|nr:DEAD/DEAH box helicase [Granulosicoccus antarcticus]ASJ70774.1 hypothetical protein IMCC3135_03305 [Granulosicoccus antarcticus IMCC3135]